MSDTERAPSSASRSTHIVVLAPASWREVAARIAPALARVDATVAAVQALVLVPTAADASDFARELLAGGPGTNASQPGWVAPLAGTRSARRLLAAAVPPVAVATAGVVVGLLRASAIALDAVGGVAICAADELERDDDALAQVLSEVPRSAARVLTAARPTPFVEQVIERHLHGARRVSAAAEPGAAVATTIEVVPVSSAAPAAALGEVLEAVDAPSVAVVPADARRESAVRDALDALGLASRTNYVRVSGDGDTAGAALVVLAGVPAVATLARAWAAPPARAVALVTARERAALAHAAPSAPLVAFRAGTARLEAEAVEAQLRDRIRGVLLDGLPAREMVALEPLLADHDSLAVAGALVRLYERERDAARRLRDAQPAPGLARPRRDAPPAQGAARPRRDAGERPGARPRR